MVNGYAQTSVMRLGPGSGPGYEGIPVKLDPISENASFYTDIIADQAIVKGSKTHDFVNLQITGSFKGSVVDTRDGADTHVFGFNPNVNGSAIHLLSGPQANINIGDTVRLRYNPGDQWELRQNGVTQEATLYERTHNNWVTIPLEIVRKNKLFWDANPATAFNPNFNANNNPRGTGPIWVSDIVVDQNVSAHQQQLLPNLYNVVR